MAANLLLGSTSNSGEKLQVTGTTKITGITNFQSRFESFNGSQNRFYRSDNLAYTELYDAGSLAANGFILDNTNGEGFHFKNGTTTIMRMNSSNNVGIGTTTPTTYAGFTTLAINNASSGGLIDFLSNNTLIGEIFNETSGFTVSAFANVSLRFRSNNTERARFTSGGNFLIGTTTDSGEKLVVNGNIKSNSSIYSESGTITINTGVTSTIFTFGNSFGNTQVYMLTAMQSSGNTSWRLSAIVIGGDLAASGAYNVYTIGTNNISASFSGANLQITNSGGNATIVWRLLRLI